MTTKQRILAIRLLESIRRQPEYARRIGVVVEEQEKGSTGMGAGKGECDDMSPGSRYQSSS